MQLAISDGSPARLRSNEALTLRDTATWFPAIPSSDMFIRGPYGRRPGRCIIHTTAPHCLAIRGPLRIRSITAVGTTAEYLQALEILFADQEKAVSLGPAMISNLDQPRPLHVDECFNMDPESERIHQADVYITTLHRDFICLRVIVSPPLRHS